LRLSLIVRTLMGGSWVENGQRPPARESTSKNPFHVKNAEFEAEPATLKSS
jgi:hypothetical protein